MDEEAARDHLAQHVALLNEGGGEGFFILDTHNGKTVLLDVSFLPETESAWAP